MRGLTPSYTPGPGTTRLRVGPFKDRAAANAACATFGKSGIACFPAAP